MVEWEWAGLLPTGSCQGCQFGQPWHQCHRPLPSLYGQQQPRWVLLRGRDGWGLLLARSRALFAKAGAAGMYIDMKEMLGGNIALLHKLEAPDVSATLPSLEQ